MPDERASYMSPQKKHPYITDKQSSEIKWTKIAAWIALIAGFGFFTNGFLRVYQGGTGEDALAPLVTMCLGTSLFISSVTLFSRAAMTWMLAMLALKPSLHVVCVVDKPGVGKLNVYDKRHG